MLTIADEGGGGVTQKLTIADEGGLGFHKWVLDNQIYVKKKQFM